MSDFHMNLSLSKWPRHALHAQAKADKYQPFEEVFLQLTPFADVLKSGELDSAFLREHISAFLTEAFASGETHRFSKVYGDDSPMGEGWRLYIDGITPAEVARQEECLEDLFKANERADCLTRMVRIDEELGLNR